MTQEIDPFYFAAVQPGTTDEFHALTGPYQRELMLHCYRILGSLDDAEDALQETLLRAWRRLDTLKEPGSLRAWLYKIATNTSLDMLSSRKARGLGPVFYAPADPADALPAPVLDPIWLEPLPDEYLAGRLPTPEAQVEANESVSLAFLAALQQLPGRQRATLILRDVLDWSAQETAEMLGLSLAAANSALQRARTTLKKNQAANSAVHRPVQDPLASQLLTRYMQAWVAADAPGLAALLREDAILTMPPLPAWYLGRATIQAFFEKYLFTGAAAGRFRVLAAHANASPALAVYQQAAGQEGQPFRPASLQVLTLQDGQVARIDCFLTGEETLFARFGLPASL